ncbi:vasoactive intestinal polypeptide receptor 2-like isoform X1 [Salvelinus namaycush]|uniref:Vasoactive intestinal polypeptide receptor 2-like isoform X1 n=1 Tax=Salvelinus namaycush TaxID=8040 RepID=A0A8U0PPX6_SALNM|nr:vasoactive intestinal polypeptide receptor 2-like isoform X1 [Salvelinus namaycush]
MSSAKCDKTPRCAWTFRSTTCSCAPCNHGAVTGRSAVPRALPFTCVSGRNPTCHFLWELQRAELVCHYELKKQSMEPAGCGGLWDNISCWAPAAVGEVVTLSCPPALTHLFGRQGNISRNCTEAGWSDVYPSLSTVCWSSDNKPNMLLFYSVVKTLYTLGHSLSLIALITSTLILCLFRRLHCTRNYIHVNLFVSFILRAVAVLVKDSVIFSHNENTDCSTQPSLVGCKVSLVMFNYFIMANFFWLLVEGLYLHTLLLVTYAYTHLAVYLAIGWGLPSVFLVVWVFCRIYLEDTGCWERNDIPTPWRVINCPIMASVIINFVLFISIIRILVQKLRCSDMGGNDQSQYRRLAKSTLLLIPLFGVNYMVFVYLVETESDGMEEYKILFDLVLGSFQGLMVAILYCFLNTEVQGELKLKWRSVSLKRYMWRDYRLHRGSISHNGTDNSTHFQRNSRAQSILQTETTSL